MFLFYHWKRCGKIHHVRPRGFKRPCRQAIFSLSILQVPFGRCRPLAASQVTRRKYFEILHKYAQPWITHMRFFGCLLDPPKTCSSAGLIKLCRTLTSLFWDVVEVLQVSLMNGHFQNYQKWSRFNGNYQNRRTSMFWFISFNQNRPSLLSNVSGDFGHKCRRLPMTRRRCRRK